MWRDFSCSDSVRSVVRARARSGCLVNDLVSRRVVCVSQRERDSETARKRERARGRKSERESTREKERASEKDSARDSERARQRDSETARERASARASKRESESESERTSESAFVAWNVTRACSCTGFAVRRPGARI